MHQGASDSCSRDRLARLGPAVRRALEAKALPTNGASDAQLRLAAAVFESSAEGVVLTDLDGSSSPSTGPSSRSPGTPLTRCSPEPSSPPVRTPGRDLLPRHVGLADRDGTVARRRSGTGARTRVYPEWITISVIRDEEGRATHYVGVFSDTGDVKEAQQQLDFLVHHDAPDRAAEPDPPRRPHRAGPSPRPGRPKTVAVLRLDIDRFGKVNDGLGPSSATGAPGQRHSGSPTRSWSAHGRALRRRQVRDRHRDAQTRPTLLLARRYQEAVAKPVDIDGHEIVVTCCIGISLYPADGADTSTLLHHADAAMRQARAAGGSRIAFHEAGVAEGLEDRLEMERLLRGAVARSELLLHYQPQVDLADGSLVGVEALVRWQLPGRGWSPRRVHPACERSGVIGTIGEWVLGEACRQVAAWQAGGLLVPRMAVTSRPALERDNLASVVRAASRQLTSAPSGWSWR